MQPTRPGIAPFDGKGNIAQHLCLEERNIQDKYIFSSGGIVVHMLTAPQRTKVFKFQSQ